ncbi:MAG TPA: hypothetical protein VLQ93_00925, partial [Myxococcaceae bacterium]|nr:hypothetical protein [Myxococcaceae bacterium]
ESFEKVELRRLPLSGASDPKQPEALVLSVKEQPVDTSGWLQFEFDPRDTFAEILRQAAPTPAERVLLRTAFVAPNGHRIEVYEGPSRSPVEVPWGFAAAPSPRAEVAGIFKTLAWPGFEPMQLSVVGRRLVIRVPLRGARRDWLNAKPVISVDGKAYPVTPSGAGLELKLPLSALQKGEVAHVDKTLDLEARITNEEALFDGERIAIAPLSLRVTTFPQLVKPLEIHSEQPGRLKLSACVRCCPTDASSLKVLCTLADDPGRPASSALSRRPIESFVQGARVTYADATPDALSRLEGRFGAELDSGHLEPGRTYRFELRPSSEDRTLFGIPVIPLHSAPYEAPATAVASP